MSAAVALDRARSRRAAVLARLPRPDQPDRRHRQRAGSAGGEAERRGNQDLRARSDQEERARPPRPGCNSAGSPSAPPARSTAQIDLGDAENMARAFLEDDKTKLAWNLPRVLLPKNRVKLLLNMLIIAGQTIPRGGTLTVDPVGEGETMGFRIDRGRAQCPHPAGGAGAARGHVGERIGRRPRDPAVLHRPAGARLRPQGRAQARGRRDRGGDAVVARSAGCPCRA